MRTWIEQDKSGHRMGPGRLILMRVQARNVETRRTLHHHHHSSRSTWGWNWDSACWAALPRAICIKSMLRALTWPLWGPGKASFWKMLGVLLDCHGIFWKLKTHTQLHFLSPQCPKRQKKNVNFVSQRGQIYTDCVISQRSPGVSLEKKKDNEEDPREKVTMSEDTLAE